MRKMLTITATMAAIALAAPAVAAPTITSAAVTGPTGTVWDTDNTNPSYTLFISRPLGNVLNPSDNFTGAAVTNPVLGDYSYSLDGDGFPTNTVRPPRGTPQIAPNSDPTYTLTLVLSEGGQSRTVSGVYTPSTATFLATAGAAVLPSGIYTLDDFSWARTLSNTVGRYSSTNTSYAAGNPGSALDYKGAFTLSSVVPEPATWGMMLVGFGAVGGALRARRKPKVAFA